MRFPDTEICYECGEPFFDLEKMGDQLLCALCHRDVANVTDKELDTNQQACYSIDVIEKGNHYDNNNPMYEMYNRNKQT